jgi:xanthine dehydrogenase YagS FAD-binding subunit
MNKFKIAQPQSLDQATAFLSQDGEKRVLMSGGTDLLDELKSGNINPEIVVELDGVSGLAYIKEAEEGMHIGGMTKVADLAEDAAVKEKYPGLVQAALSLATPQLRNVGTVGGNLCQRPRCWYYRDPEVNCRKKGGRQCFALQGRNKYHAVLGGSMCFIVHPSDLAPMLVSLEAEAVIATTGKDKRIPLQDFFILPSANIRKENVLEPGEMLKEVIIPPKEAGFKCTYFKLKERSTWDFAVVSAAVSGNVSNGVFKNIKVVLGGTAPVPWHMESVDKAVQGKKATADLVRRGVEAGLKDAYTLEENEYKLDLLKAVIPRTVMSLL